MTPVPITTADMRALLRERIARFRIQGDVYAEKKDLRRQKEAARVNAEADVLEAILARLEQQELAAQPEPAAAVDLLSEDKERRLEELAFGFHVGIEGEYGCPGATCPGVQRLIVRLRGMNGVGVAEWVKRANMADEEQS